VQEVIEMAKMSRRCTIYMDPEIHRALRVQSAETGRSISELIDYAVRYQLLEDLEDIQACEDRADEPSISFEEVVKELKRLGKL
jgi:predicted DNA-binding protein